MIIFLDKKLLYFWLKWLYFWLKKYYILISENSYKKCLYFRFKNGYIYGLKIFNDKNGYIFSKKIVIFLVKMFYF